MSAPFSSSASTPVVHVNQEDDTLVISLNEVAEPADCVLDDEEIFVFKESDSGQVVAFVVPNYHAYWQSHLEDLIDHLDTYDLSAPISMTSALYGRREATEHDFFVGDAA